MCALDIKATYLLTYLHFPHSSRAKCGLDLRAQSIASEPFGFETKQSAI